MSRIHSSSSSSHPLLLLIWRGGLAWLVVWCLLAGPVNARQTTAPAQEAVSSYTVVIQGVDEEREAFLRSIAKSTARQEEGADSLGLLRKRGNDDAAIFKQALIADGHLNATVEVAIDQNATTHALRFTITQGPVYTLSEVRYTLVDQPGANATEAFPPPGDVGLIIGDPFQAALVSAAQGKLETHLQRHGFPYAKAERPQILASLDTPTVRIIFPLTAGPLATFGATTFEGLTSVDPDFLADEPRWVPGELYDHEKLRELEKRLAKLNLFGAIGAMPAKELNEDGSVDIIVTLGERKHRTIRGGVAYKSDVGLSASLGWEHRNLLGAGETLNFDLDASVVESRAKVSFTNPKFLHPDQAFRSSLEAKVEDTAAYEANSLTGRVLVERTIGEKLEDQGDGQWKLAAGLAFRQAEVARDEANPDQGELSYSLLSIPMDVSLDTRDSILDPTQGVFVTGHLEPFYGIGQSTLSSDFFLQAEARARAFYQISKSPRIILAGRGAFGAYLGLPGEELPPVLRYYTGGGGSVRGYRYQTAGPFRGENPTGGSYLVELSGEVRFRVTENLGIVPFIDAGNVYDSLGSISDGLLFGGGIGLRYATPIGPLRLDFAMPFEKRSVDDAFQVYISVGQAF